MSSQLVAVSTEEIANLNATIFMLILEYRIMVGHLKIISEAELELGDTI